MAVVGAVHSATAHPVAVHSRLPLIDAMRAVLASTIAWHHFVIYWPLSDVSTELNDSLTWLRDYRWVVPAFFVVSGFVMAGRMLPRSWSGHQAAIFVFRRYCRLGMPYLAAVALALIACWAGRGVVPAEVIGPPPTFEQLLAHLVFLQDILGYPSLSAGLWFVCIDFQLSLILVGMLLLRDALASPRIDPRVRIGRVLFVGLGWLLAVSSLFYFNLHSDGDVWPTYYFGYFFLGVLIAEALGPTRRDRAFELYLVVTCGALAFYWRWRLAVAIASGLLIYLGGKAGLLTRWPESRLFAYLGITSYSLFLVHFPVLIVVETVWFKLDWTMPKYSIVGLITAYVLSLAAADIFYRAIELPALRLSQRCKVANAPAVEGAKSS